MITTWYLQSHRTRDRSCHSCIGSPSRPEGPSRRGSLCRLVTEGTPDRSKLFGSTARGRGFMSSEELNGPCLDAAGGLGPLASGRAVTIAHTVYLPCASSV